MIIDEDVYLEHFGVQGMKWGVRKAARASVVTGKAVGKGSVATAKASVVTGKAVGRGTKKTGKFLYRHKKAVATTAAGAVIAAAILGKASSHERLTMSSADFANKAAAGKARYAAQGLGVLRVKSIDVVSRSVERGTLV